MTDTLFSGPMIPAALVCLAVLAAIPAIITLIRNHQATEEVSRRLVRRTPGAEDQPRRNESRIAIRTAC